MRIILGATVALVLAAQAVAGPAPAPTAAPQAGLVAWLVQSTDLAPAQVAIAGDDNVYSLEPLGPPGPTGEVVALVRTEARTVAWRTSHGFQSWDAHVLFDCAARRMRIIRSASYSGPRRQGQPKVEVRQDGWISPKAGEPAEQLLGAACDPAFRWPLRTAERAKAWAPPIVEAQVAAARPIPANTAPLALARAIAEATAPPTKAAPPPSSPSAKDAPTPAAQELYAIQVAYGPLEDGAQRALRKARKVLNPLDGGIEARVETAQLGHKSRYTALLSGFPSAEAATTACKTLVKAGQECRLRKPAPARDPTPTTAAAKTDTASAADPAAASAPVPAAGAAGAYRVQVARGPMEEGAQRALRNARATLGREADALTATTEATQVGRRRRYTAVLSGFPTQEAAASACKMLVDAGQGCLVMKGPDVAELSASGALKR